MSAGIEIEEKKKKKKEGTQINTDQSLTKTRKKDEMIITEAYLRPSFRDLAEKSKNR